MAVPTRSCLACRRRDTKPSLIRVAVVDGTIVLDPSANVPGRGAYLCSRPACADAALARGSAKLLRALRADSATQVDEQALRAAQSVNSTGQASSSRNTAARRSASSAGVWQ